MNDLLLFLFSIKVAFCTCHAENKRSGFRSGRQQYAVRRVGRLASAVNESSGLVHRPARNTFWTHNDSGGRPVLYEVTPEGALVDSLPLAGLTNVDWEALAHQDSTTLFIGDIGNNSNTRRDLAIHRLSLASPARSETIRFHYAGQSAFPPPIKDLNFDSEALFFRHDSLFLLSKNRSWPRRRVNLYGMPARAGQYALVPADSVFIKSMVTDADLSPDGQTLAVLTYGKVLLFKVVVGQSALRYPQQCLRIPRGQTEGISFVNNTDFVLTNERGRVYLVRRK